MIVSFIISILASVIVSELMIPRILSFAYRRRLFDIPNERKEHKTPVPRLGGLSFLPSILIAFTLAVIQLALSANYNIGVEQTCELASLAAGALVLYAVGVKDDISGMKWNWKMFFQIMSGVLIVMSGNQLATLAGLFGIHSIPGYVSIPATIFLTIYITNAINFIDGIDGLASGLCCFSLSIIAGIFLFQHDYLYALLATATIGAVIPFWFYNMFGNIQKQHKIFMGDSGSLMLGYVLSLCIIHLGNARHSTPEDESRLLLALSTLCVPLLDAMRVAMSRIFDRKSPFLPDREHIHHKLHDAGLETNRILLYIVLMALCFMAVNATMLYCFHARATLILVADIALGLYICRLPCPPKDETSP